MPEAISERMVRAWAFWPSGRRGKEGRSIIV